MHRNGSAWGFPSIEKSTCAAVISAYRPPSELVGRVEGLLRQFSTVVVVDDGSDDDGVVVRQCREKGATTVALPSNQGIAAALNRGVAEVRAVAPAVEFVVTFDQDSSPGAGYLDGLAAAAREAARDEVPVGCLGPGRINGSGVPSARPAGSYAEIVEPIQSGMLVPLRILEEIGGFDETLFIDGVDTDTYWRLREAGYVAVAARAVSLDHQLGSRSQARLFGRPLVWRGQPVMIMQSAPFRYYYLARNRCALIRRHGRSFAAPMARGLALDLRHLVVVLVLGSDRSTRMRFAVRGLIDGMRGKQGKMGSPAERVDEGSRS
jgi:rhamnosyltransferase